MFTIRTQVTFDVTIIVEFYRILFVTIRAHKFFSFEGSIDILVVKVKDQECPEQGPEKPMGVRFQWEVKPWQSEYTKKKLVQNKTQVKKFNY